MLEINGEKCCFKPGQSIGSLLRELGINPAQVVVEHNGQIPSRVIWEETLLQSGDRLEIVKFMGGG